MASRRSFLSLVALGLLSLPTLTLAAAGDITYDDTDPAWVYTPSNSWGAISDKNLCDACNTKPDPTKVHGGTWHDLSKGGSAQLSFVGSGIVVYAVCPQGIYRSNFTFLLDNEPAAGLKVAPHIFQVNNWIAPGEEFSTSDLVLDYAVVTTTGSSDNGISSSTGTSGSSTVQPPTKSVSSSSTATSSGSKPTTTVDDVDDAWKYTGPWGAISAAAPCDACVVKPDATKAHGTTWHDLSNEGSASLLFSGTAISVYAICPGPLADGGAFVSNFAFTLDGKDMGKFAGPAGGCKAYEYNQLVYEGKGLEQGTHNFTISNIIATSGLPSDLVLDYAVIEGTVGGSGAGTTTTTAPRTDPTASASTQPETNDNSAGRTAAAAGLTAFFAAAWTFALVL
ncbi:hypothetical protein BKA62DRAFT_791019 [Auriculariales sp. MPI-PUGE-AT-0066]|nr:hypothetical protein BKA62DRAFT_791019 [Auriculariales sp. MPI-PUGE-AT-0066]